MRSTISRLISARSVVGACGVALALSGCGSGDSTGDSTTSSASVASSAAATSADGRVVSRLDVAYADGGGASHRLDLFTPGPSAQTSTEPLPVVVFVHGGGWHSGDKESARAGAKGLESPLSDLLVANGYAVASVNYRLSGEATYPAPMHDVKSAVRYLRANAAELGLDPDRFALAGESAGGHLAMLAATTASEPSMEGEVGTTGVSSQVKAVVSYYGLADIRDRNAMSQAAGCGVRERSGPGSEERMLGETTDTPRGAELAAEASPLTHVTKDDPPMLLLAGTTDCTAPPLQSERMHDALTKVGVTSEVVILEVGHGDPSFYTSERAQNAALEFLDARVK